MLFPPLINPITQLALQADLTFKMSQTVASHMVDAAQVLHRERSSAHNSRGVAEHFFDDCDL